jgi:hypothetical protein
MAKLLHGHINSGHPIQEPSFSRGNHQPRSVAVLPVLLSFRDVEELLFERGVTVTYEAIRKLVLLRLNPRRDQLRSSTAFLSTNWDESLNGYSE